MIDETTALIDESGRLEKDYGDGHEVKEHMVDVTGALTAAERALDAIAAIIETKDLDESRLADIEKVIEDTGRSRTPYPACLVVFCDRCGDEESADFLVLDTTSSATRLGWARARAAGLGWVIKPNSDLCPDCVGAVKQAAAKDRKNAAARAARARR